MEVKIINNRPVKIWTNDVEESAMRQIENLTTLPFLHHHLAIMPDVHAGMGMPIGGVLACDGAVIPNAVGVDIGCGMCAVKTNWKMEDLPAHVIRKEIMKGIRARIPLGMDHHKEAQDAKYLPQGHDIDKMEIVKRRQHSILHEVGTLGGGNHFIELQKDEEGNLWIMIHSGSRNLGKQVGDYYNKIAVSLNEKWHSVVSPEIRLPFLPHGTREFGAYWNEMKYCIDFALCNRRLMMERIQEVIADSLKGIEFEPMINIAHNYAAIEHHFGEDGQTVYGAYFNHESETAGLGAEIKDSRKWQEKFQGKHLYGNDGEVALSVVKKVENPDTQVDAITGATLTSNGVSAMLHDCIEKYKKQKGRLSKP